MSRTKKTVVVSVGGSLIVPDEIDIAFLKQLRITTLSLVKRGYRFVYIIGGGKTARRYMNAAMHFPNVTKKERDTIGITAILSNAHLLRLVFKGHGQDVIINPHQETWEPGSSSDVDAVNAAEEFGARTVINLSNIDYVYDKDPKRHKNAKPLKHLSWKAFRALLPATWDPGLNVPFDPIAARKADNLSIEVIIMNGKKPKEFERYLKGEIFKGTTIR